MKSGSEAFLIFLHFIWLKWILLVVNQKTQIVREKGYKISFKIISFKIKKVDYLLRIAANSSYIPLSIIYCLSKNYKLITEC